MIYASIFLLAMLKFLVALVAAVANPNWGFWEVVLTAGLGAWSSVILYAFFGTAFRRWLQRRFPRRSPVKYSRKKKLYLLWKRYGLVGVSFLSLVISPMVSVGIAVSFREDIRRIIFWNSLSIIFWTLVFASFREFVVTWFA